MNQRVSDRPQALLAYCYHTGPIPLIGFIMKPSERPPMTFRKLLEILAAVAVLELGFFLFRLGATWWNQ